MNVKQTIREDLNANLITLILQKVIIGFNKQSRTWENFSSFEYDVWQIYRYRYFFSTFVWVFFMPPKIQFVFWDELMRVSFSNPNTKTKCILPP